MTKSLKLDSVPTPNEYKICERETALPRNSDHLLSILLSLVNHTLGSSIIGVGTVGKSSPGVVVTRVNDAVQVPPHFRALGVVLSKLGSCAFLISIRLLLRVFRVPHFDLIAVPQSFETQGFGNLHASQRVRAEVDAGSTFCHDSAKSAKDHTASRLSLCDRRARHAHVNLHTFILFTPQPDPTHVFGCAVNPFLDGSAIISPY